MIGVDWDADGPHPYRHAEVNAGPHLGSWAFDAMDSEVPCGICGGSRLVRLHLDWDRERIGAGLSTEPSTGA